MAVNPIEAEIAWHVPVAQGLPCVLDGCGNSGVGRVTAATRRTVPHFGRRMNEEASMRICIPTEDDRGSESRVFNHFGTAPFFTIVDVETSRLEVVTTDGHHRQQRDHHIPELKAHHVSAVVCDRIGKRACAALRHAGIDVLAAVGGTVSDVLKAVNAGETSTILPADACGGRGPRDENRRERRGTGRAGRQYRNRAGMSGEER